MSFEALVGPATTSPLSGPRSTVCYAGPALQCPRQRQVPHRAPQVRWRCDFFAVLVSYGGIASTGTKDFANRQALNSTLPGGCT
eukprot:scaffold175_cov414-Prasinococcus_capsulatus_cf.AAC.17